VRPRQADVRRARSSSLPRRARSARGRAAGFTLLEILVALMILSIAVVAALQLFGGGLRLARAAADHQEATLLAKAKLAEIAFDNVEEGTTEATEGNFRWTRRVAFDPDLLPNGAQTGTVQTVRLARVSVEVRWGRNRHVELVTLRAVSGAP
jgi:general secretion pathway protein I